MSATRPQPFRLLAAAVLSFLIAACGFEPTSEPWTPPTRAAEPNTEPAVAHRPRSAGRGSASVGSPGSVEHVWFVTRVGSSP